MAVGLYLLLWIVADKHLLLLLGAFVVVLQRLLTCMPSNLNNGLPLDISCSQLFCQGFSCRVVCQFLTGECYRGAFHDVFHHLINAVDTEPLLRKQHSSLFHLSITAKWNGPLSRNSGGRLLRKSLNRPTGHLGPPAANILGRTRLRLLLRPPCLVFVGFSLKVMYSMPRSSLQRLKSSTFIKWYSWRPYNPKCCVRIHHMV